MNEESTITSNAYHNEQTGQAPPPVLSYSMGSRAALVCVRLSPR